MSHYQIMDQYWESSTRQEYHQPIMDMVCQMCLRESVRAYDPEMRIVPNYMDNVPEYDLIDQIPHIQQEKDDMAQRNIANMMARLKLGIKRGSMKVETQEKAGKQSGMGDLLKSVVKQAQEEVKLIQAPAPFPELILENPFMPHNPKQEEEKKELDGQPGSIKEEVAPEINQVNKDEEVSDKIFDFPLAPDDDEVGTNSSQKVGNVFGQLNLEKEEEGPNVDDNDQPQHPQNVGGAENNIVEIEDDLDDEVEVGDMPPPIILIENGAVENGKAGVDQQVEPFPAPPFPVIGTESDVQQGGDGLDV